MPSSFHPVFGQTKSLSATASSGNVRMADGLPQGTFQMRIYNAGTDLVFVRFGATSALAAATIADHPVPSGAVEVITLNNDDRNQIQYAAAICASSTATVYFTPGHGI